jgi:hypothetical protein
LGRNRKEEPALARSWDHVKDGVRRHVFRTWTAGAVLAGFAYAWVYEPELLTGWKRATTAAIEAGCGLLPYPWNDRIEATLGDFGLWVQITLAVILFRVLVWLVMVLVRAAWSAGAGRNRRRNAGSVGVPNRGPDGVRLRE